MASRYGPGVPIYQPGAAQVNNALAQALGAVERRDDREERRRLLESAERRADAAERRAAEEARRAEQRHAIDAYLAGFRETAPTRPRQYDPSATPPAGPRLRFSPHGPTIEPERPSIRARGALPMPADAPALGRDMMSRGEGVGVPLGDPAAAAPRVAGGPSALGAALEESLAPSAEEGPRLRALPGAFVPGVGFADRPIFDRPVSLEAPTSLADPRMVGGVETPEHFARLPGGGYLDTMATPEARALARAEEERERARTEQEAQRTALAEALGALEHLSPEQAEALALGAPAGVVMPHSDSDRDLIRVRGRSFPNTPEGAAEALAWARLFEPPDTGDATARRMRAIQAAQAITRLDPPRTASMQRTYDEHVDRILRLHGFSTVDELSEAMQSLGMPGAVEPVRFGATAAGAMADDGVTGGFPRVIQPESGGPAIVMPDRHTRDGQGLAGGFSWAGSGTEPPPPPPPAPVPATALRPLSDAEIQAARTNPEFAEFLREQGYTDQDWSS